MRKFVKMTVTAILIFAVGVLPVFAAGETAGGETALDFEVIYARGWNTIEPMGGGFTVYSDLESAELLARINGDGDLSGGRIGEDHTYDPETQCLAVLAICFGAVSSETDNTVISELTLSDGNITAVVHETYKYPDQSDAEVTYHFVLILEKEQLTSLDENSEYYREYHVTRYEGLDPSYGLEPEYVSGTVKEPLVFPEIVLHSYDINMDGATDVKDLTRLMQVISGAEVDAAWTDVNSDGETDAKDLTRLMKHLAAGEANG